MEVQQVARIEVSGVPVIQSGEDSE